MNKENKCRLCNNHTSKMFSKTILGKYDVEYFECANCGSLQTEKPYWLHEAYSNKKISSLDTGAVQRNIHNLAACFAVSKIFNIKNAIDIGGGDGLLCRMLRDYGINCYVKDKYTSPTYAQGFSDQNFDKPDLIIGFEILEHFENPSIDLENLFEYTPNIMLLSTAIYSNETSDWWYLVPEAGQHVFFYSKKALELIAEKYQYSLVVSGEFILFVKNNTSSLRINLAKILLKNRIARLIKSYVVFLPTPGVWQDHLDQVQKLKQTQ